MKKDMFDSKYLLTETGGDRFEPAEPKIKKRRMPVFYRVYLTLLVLFGILLAVGAFFLNA